MKTVKTKVVIFNENWIKGGNDIYTESIIKFLDNNDYSIDFILNLEGTYNKKIKYKHVRIIHYDTINFGNKISYSKKVNNYLKKIHKFLFIFKPILFFINIIRFYYLLKKLKPKIVMACNGGYPAAESCLAIIIASRILKIKNILSIASIPQKRKLLLFPYEIILDKLLNLSCDIIITGSNAQMNELTKRRGSFSSKKIILK